MKVIYYDKNTRRGRSIYISPKDNRSGRILAVIDCKPLSLHPLDLLHSLVLKVVGIILVTILKLIRSTKKSKSCVKAGFIIN